MPTRRPGFGFDDVIVLRPRRTVMVISGRSVNLSTPFLDRLSPP